MIVYHGTTRRNANQIRVRGFLPRKPSRRVWFTQHRGYAKQRANCQARRAQDHPVVLKCDVNVDSLRKQHGGSRVISQNHVIAIRGKVPASAICEEPGNLTHLPLEFTHLPLECNVPNSPGTLARWLNEVLSLKPHKGVSRNDPAVQRLLTWISNRFHANPRGTINRQELLAVARQWLPDFFEGVEVDFQHLRTLPAHGSMTAASANDEDVEEEPPPRDPHDDEEEILDCLLSEKPQRRIRGLQLLTRRRDPDLFEWAMMLLGDAELSVQVASLQAMRQSPDVVPALIEDLAEDDDRRVRAAAIEVLAVCEGEGADDDRKWLWAGMTDPDSHVRMTVVKHLQELEPEQYRDIFDAALHDPNPEIARLAGRLTEGKGFGKPSW